MLFLFIYLHKHFSSFYPLWWFFVEWFPIFTLNSKKHRELYLQTDEVKQTLTKMRPKRKRNLHQSMWCFLDFFLRLLLFVVCFVQNKSKIKLNNGNKRRATKIWLLKLPNWWSPAKGKREKKREKATLDHRLSFDDDISRIFSRILTEIKIYNPMCLCWQQIFGAFHDSHYFFSCAYFCARVNKACIASEFCNIDQIPQNI